MKAKRIVLVALSVAAVSTGAVLETVEGQSIGCPYSYSVNPQPDWPYPDYVRGQSTTSCTAQTSIDTYSTIQWATSSSGPWSNLGYQHQLCVNAYQCTAIAEYRKIFGSCGYYYRTVGDHYWFNGIGTSYGQTISGVVFDNC